MKTLDIARATRPLWEYARRSRQGAVVVTRRGKPIAAVVRVRDTDMESLPLATNPDFIALIERSRARRRAEGRISIEEMRRRYGIPGSPRQAGTRRP